MTQEEVLAFIAQHVNGGAGKALYSKTSKQIDNPLAGTPGHLADPEKITVTVEQWKTPDGQVVFEGYRDPSNDQYVALQQNTPKAPTATAAETKATAKGQKLTIENGEAVTREIEADGSQGRILEQRPATKAEIEQAAGAQGQATSASNKKPVPGKPGIYEVTGATKDPQGNSISETHYEDEQGNRVPTPGGTEKSSSAREPVPGKPGTYIVKAGTVDANGNASSDTHYEDEQGNRIATPTEMPKQLVDLPNGTKGQLIADPDNPGQWKAVPVSGTEKPADTAVPSVDLTGASVSDITGRLKKKWDDDYVPLINAGTLTMADALKQFERDRLMAEAEINGQTTRLNAQQNIRSQDVTQRGQTLTSVENQRSNYTATARDILGQVLKNPAPGGLQAAEAMIRGIGTLGQQMGIPMGVPSEQPYTPQQAQVMGAPAPSPIVFNINTGSPVAATTPLAGVGAQMGVGGAPETPGALPPPTNPEQLLDEMRRNSPDQFWNAALDRVQGDLQAAREKAAGGVAPGMSLSGGQLRAPGAGPVGAGPVGQVG